MQIQFRENKNIQSFRGTFLNETNAKLSETSFSHIKEAAKQIGEDGDLLVLHIGSRGPGITAIPKGEIESICTYSGHIPYQTSVENEILYLLNNSKDFINNALKIFKQSK